MRRRGGANAGTLAGGGAVSDAGGAAAAAEEGEEQGLSVGVLLFLAGWLGSGWTRGLVGCWRLEIGWPAGLALGRLSAMKSWLM